MVLTEKDLFYRLQFGDSGFLGLKKVQFQNGKILEPKQNEIADEIAAFANNHGGMLLFGVDDKTRDVLGIPMERLDEVEKLILRASEVSIRPSIAPLLNQLSLPNSHGTALPVISVGISASNFVHQSPKGYFQRIGSSKRIIQPDQLARLFEQRSRQRLMRFDETSIGNSDFHDLDETLWQKFASKRTNESPEQFLSKLAMVSLDESGIWRPTVAGILLASRDPRKILSNAYIQAVAYGGNSISVRERSEYQLDALDITGPLNQQILDACHFVRKNMRVAARKSLPGGRHDLPQYDMFSVFEAVTNAVAHRDYSLTGSKIRLRMFDDRLELYSPGGLVNSMTTESLAHRQASRNEVIASLLARCPVEREDILEHRDYIMDRRGEGVPVIFSRSEKLSGRTPEFRLFDESELLLTIYARTEV